MKSKIKKRSLNELRQSKDYNYKAPTSHKQAKTKNATICFTKETLSLFLEDAIAHFLQADPKQCSGLNKDCKNYVKTYYFNS
tara:strand:- start:782 stop:1027 length:246 start_codon:yes stop_codon:yes gene_type:complete